MTLTSIAVSCDGSQYEANQTVALARKKAFRRNTVFNIAMAAEVQSFSVPAEQSSESYEGYAYGSPNGEQQ